MPNTPALVGAGATALAPGDGALAEDMAVATSIFDSIGITVNVKEDLIDAVTGLSGSGPAYFFIIVDSLAKGGVLMGLPRDIAYKLAIQTMLGSASSLSRAESTDGPARHGHIARGTTIAGIQALEEGGLRAA